MHAHTGEGHELSQSQMKQDDWSEEAQKDCLHTSDLNDLQSMCHSLPILLFLCLSLPLSFSFSLPPPVFLSFFHTYLLSLLLNKYLFASWPSASLQNSFSKGTSSRDLPQVVRVQCSHPTATWEQCYHTMKSLPDLDKHSWHYRTKWS